MLQAGELQGFTELPREMSCCHSAIFGFVSVCVLYGVNHSLSATECDKIKSQQPAYYKLSFYHWVCKSQKAKKKPSSTQASCELVVSFWLSSIYCFSLGSLTSFGLTRCQLTQYQFCHYMQGNWSHMTFILLQGNPDLLSWQQQRQKNNHKQLHRIGIRSSNITWVMKSPVDTQEASLRGTNYQAVWP